MSVGFVVDIIRGPWALQLIYETARQKRVDGLAGWGEGRSLRATLSNKRPSIGNVDRIGSVRVMRQQ